MNERVSILNKINEIETNHCLGCEMLSSDHLNFCYEKCLQGMEIKRLGDALSNRSKDKINRLLDKGHDITTEEIKYLINKGVTRTEITKALKVDRSSAKSWFDSILYERRGTNV